jgi:hypothetical protein
MIASNGKICGVLTLRHFRRDRFVMVLWSTGPERDAGGEDERADDDQPEHVLLTHRQ